MNNFTVENLIAVPSSDIPSGTLAIKIGQYAFIANNLTSNSDPLSIDTSDATASAHLILSGYTAYINNQKVSGTIPTVCALYSANNVIIPSGFIAEQEHITIPTSDITINGNQVIVDMGYIADNTLIDVGTSIAASSITPGSSNIVIPSGSFLNGDQTILGDANLVPSNILSGVTIFGVSGNYIPQESGLDLYKCTEISIVTTNDTPTSITVSGYSFDDDPDPNGTYTKVNNETVASWTADSSLYTFLAGYSHDNYVIAKYYLTDDPGTIFWSLYWIDPAGRRVTYSLDNGITWSLIENTGAFTGTNGTIIFNGVSTGNTSWSGQKLIVNNGNPEFDSNITSGLKANGFDPVTGMIYMVTNDQIVACLSSLIPENIKAGIEIFGIHGSYSNTSEPEQETREYLTQDYTGNINVEIAWPEGTVNNVELPYINSGTWKKDASGTPCLCSEDGCCDNLYVYLPNKKYYSNYNGWVGCQDVEGGFGCNIITFASAETQIPLNVNLVTYQQSVLHFGNDLGPSSVIITKVN